MAQYEHVRSSSPPDECRTSNDLELQEHNGEKIGNLVSEQEERLLPADSEETLEFNDNDDDDDHDRSRRRRRRRWCRLGLFGLIGIILFSIIALFLDHLYFQKSEDDVNGTFRRQSSDYIIDPDWDYNAPPTRREYHWVITDITANPDGVFRPMMVINGQFPGPMIVCNEGDTIVVNLVNEAKNATAIHWHGLFQNGTNWHDGTVGVTQCPIAPGRSFRYEFTVKGQAGSYFYHGHQGTQSLDGLVGPLIILSAEEKENQPIPYDTDRVVMVQDWYHVLSDGLLRETLSPGSESSPTPNGALINGANKLDCSLHPKRHCDASTALLPTFDLAPNKQHRLRVINIGGFAWFEVSIDKHINLPVTEVDGVTVEPASDSSVLIGPGQRYSIILSANQTDPSNLYWFRARMINHCFAENVLPDKGVATARAVIRYNTSDPVSKFDGQPDLPTTENDSGKFTVVCKDDNEAYRPLPARPAPEYAHHSWYLRVNLEIGAWRLERGFLNQSTFRPHIQSPTLHRFVQGLGTGNETFAIEGVNDRAFGQKNELVVSSEGVEVVDVILQNFDEGNHPFHLHGQQMFILAQGHGYFPGYEELGLNPEGKGLLDPNDRSIISNPLRRDVTAVEAFGWTLIRFVADNPGIWLLHCHMIWHGEAGMAMQFASRLDIMRNWTIPKQSAKLCEAPLEELERGSVPKDSI
ncbi:Laccase-2 [Cytospora mali]|uniref:Laccase-2 n=1 Tax=Cytospora mali TaxID=578113 RepID=A0A194VHD4_CYTMA|nr:Laccase-2 [Valsa mali var. pyri (nom. inval.)]